MSDPTSRVVLVSQESDPREVEALHRFLNGRAAPEAWHEQLATLALGDVALLERHIQMDLGILSDLFDQIECLQLRLREARHFGKAFDGLDVDL